jgi:antitoxin VapB
MTFTIQDPEADRLAREIADLTGESLSDAVRTALARRLTELKAAADREAKIARMKAIGADCARHMREPARATDHGDLLYDEQGLPR